LVKHNNILLNDSGKRETKPILQNHKTDSTVFCLFFEDRIIGSKLHQYTILKEWKALADLDVDVPLIRPLNNTSVISILRKGTEKKEEIFAYNGGLFQPDAILDAIIIDNDLLYRHTLKLSTYDFESQVDVNILGHIFEHSLNEIESVNAEIEGTDFDKQNQTQERRCFLPKIHTKYIVDNTIGKLCTEKNKNWHH
jgi:hypothetical protein